jgi:hypothetical protein
MALREEHQLINLDSIWEDCLASVFSLVKFDNIDHGSFFSGTQLLKVKFCERLTAALPPCQRHVFKSRGCHCQSPTGFPRHETVRGHMWLACQELLAFVHTWREYRGYRTKDDPDVTIPWTGAVINLETQILCEGGPFDPRGVVTCDKLCLNK